MEVATARATVAGSREGHAGFTTDFERQCRAGRDWHVVSQVADEADHSAFQIAHVHVAVFAFCGPGLFAEVLGDNFSGENPRIRNAPISRWKGR